MRMNKTFRKSLDYTLTLVVGGTLFTGTLIFSLWVYGVAWYSQ